MISDHSIIYDFFFFSLNSSITVSINNAALKFHRIWISMLIISFDDFTCLLSSLLTLLVQIPSDACEEQTSIRIGSMLIVSNIIKNSASFLIYVCRWTISLISIETSSSLVLTSYSYFTSITFFSHSWLLALCGYHSFIWSWNNLYFYGQRY